MIQHRVYGTLKSFNYFLGIDVDETLTKSHNPSRGPVSCINCTTHKMMSTRKLCSGYILLRSNNFNAKCLLGVTDLCARRPNVCALFFPTNSRASLNWSREHQNWRNQWNNVIFPISPDSVYRLILVELLFGKNGELVTIPMTCDNDNDNGREMC